MSDRLRTSNRLVGPLRAYGRELHLWVGKIESHYVAAFGLVALGVVCLIASLGIATSALISLLASRFGLFAAYEMVGGGVFAVGLVAVGSSALLLRRKLPPLPSPRPQADAFKRSITSPAAARIIFGEAEEGAGTDLTTRLLAGAAAVLLLGWLAGSYLRRPAGPRRESR